MSWQHWILLVAYVVSVISAVREDEDSRRSDLGVFGGLIGIMLLVWGQQ